MGAERYYEIFDVDLEAGKLYWKSGGPHQRKAGREAGWVGSEHGYRRVTFGEETLRVHRIIWEIVNGAIPDGMVIDHINKDEGDNRPSNLRLCTNKQNARNRKRNSNNISGVRGVGWSNAKQQWVVRIGVDSRSLFIGRFDKLADAAKARRKAELKYFGDFAPCIT